MEDNGVLVLTTEEERLLFGIIRSAIAHGLQRNKGTVPVPPEGALHRELGAFVTLKIHGDLRGCIGSLVGKGPLYGTVWNMARAAAFEDPRFQPLTLREVDDLELEVSVMGPVTPCTHPEHIEVGRHGLIVQQGAHSGVLLPQVPVEWGWDRETFLAQTCRKAGLAQDCWRDGRTSLFWFEATILGPRKYCRG